MRTLTALAYTMAPRTTFALRHPRAALRWKATRYALRHSLAPRITGAAAAALALPLGMWLGRKMNKKMNKMNGRKREE